MFSSPHEAEIVGVIVCLMMTAGSSSLVTSID